MTGERESVSTDDRPRRIADRLALTPLQTLTVGLAGALLLLVDHAPLAGELWAQLNRGHWVLAERSLPTVEPFLPLAEGMTPAHDGWLAQVALAVTDRQAGLEGVSLLLALVTLAACILIGRRLYAGTRSGLWALAGVLAACLLAWPQLTAHGPARFGFLFFCAFCWLLVERSGEPTSVGVPELSLVHWLAVPLGFALWVNLDVSFLAGLAVLACLWVGRAVDVGRRTRSFAAVLADASFRRALILFEFALGATLLNPGLGRPIVSGLGLSLGQVLGGGRALTLTGLGGASVLVSWVLVVVALRRSRRPLAAADALILALFSGALVRGVTSLAGLYGVVWAMVVVPHLAAALRSRKSAPLEQSEISAPPRASWRYGLIAALLVWAVFSFSPVGAGVLRGQARTTTRLLGDEAPIALAGHLEADPPTGLFFAPPAWSDWLLREVPGLQPVSGGAPALLPPRVRADFGRVARVSSGWDSLLDRYAVQSIAVDKARQRQLLSSLHRSLDWYLHYEDRTAALFERVPRTATAAPEQAPQGDDS